MKNKIFLALLLTVTNITFVLAQSGGFLYFSSQGTGRVYDITGTTPSTVQTTLPAGITTPAYFNANNGIDISNLAVGYDTTVANQPLVFIHSSNANGANVLKNGVATGNTLPAGIGGLGTNNVLGTNFGQIFGFSGKNLYRVYPTVSAAIPITGDAIWNGTGGNNSTVFASDTFYDYQNNVYTILENLNGTTYTRYLYKIAINGAVSAATATQVAAITGPVGVRNATVGTSTTIDVGNVRGSAYLNGFVFVASGNTAGGASEALIYRINISTGASNYLATYTGTGFGTNNLDLASVDYFVPFTFNCNSIALQGTTPYMAGSSSTRTLRIPVSNIYSPGNYVINVTGTDFTNPSFSASVTTATTFIDVPLTYNGTGGAGSRTLTVDLNGSTTTCTILATIEPDTDSDGLADSVDLDSDNDGILDLFECTESVVNQPYNTSNGTTVSFSAPAADLGFVFDVYTLDNSFNLNINGVNLATSEIQFQSDQVDNIRFVGGDRYGIGSVPQIYSMTGNATNPLIRIIIQKNGSVSIYGSKASNGPLFPLELYNGNVLNTITWNRTGANSVILSQAVVGATYITGNGNGLRNGFCDPDNDLISNQFDTDSDGDGCPDAIEGSENVTYSMVNPLTAPTNPGQIKVLANGTTAGTPAQVISTVPAANGVPLLVNNAANNTGGVAGVADNTGTSPLSGVGQAVGNSQNSALNDCKCYRNPTTTLGTDNATIHGITAFNRAGANSTNWPMIRNNGWTALEANTKAFVINRMPVATTTAGAVIAGEPVNAALTSPVIALPIVGMTFYDTTNNCMKINTDGTRTGWKCFNTQSCPEEN